MRPRALAGDSGQRWSQNCVNARPCHRVSREARHGSSTPSPPALSTNTVPKVRSLKKIILERKEHAHNPTQNKQRTPRAVWGERDVGTPARFAGLSGSQRAAGTSRAAAGGCRPGPVPPKTVLKINIRINVLSRQKKAKIIPHRETPQSKYERVFCRQR